MKTRFLSLILSVFALTLIFTVLPASAQTTAFSSIDVICPDGTPVNNGVEVIINMRPGFTYTATAIGIDDFDPILAVRDQNDVGLCNADDATAADYSADLPTSGAVPASNQSARVPFSHNYNDFANISLIVADENGAGGEFILVLEGMAVTDADGRGVGAGDPFEVHLTSNVASGGFPINAYMISLTDDLDPLMQWVNTSTNEVMIDDTNTPIQCDDAGAETCWGASEVLKGSYVTSRQGLQLGGYELDSMLQLDFNGIDLTDGDYYAKMLMTSYNQETFGEYLVAFHLGIGEGQATGGKGTKGERGVS
jgi:hypothetical protein